eukprot:3029926-Amphidinium_carterae.1
MAHQRARHNVVSKARTVVKDNFCPYCDQDFGSRERVIHHVSLRDFSCGKALFADESSALTPAEFEAAEARSKAEKKSAK